MPRDRKLWVNFKIQKWKWYLVDLRDYLKPVLVRKHLDSELQALQFKEKYYDYHYDVINWKDAKEYNLKAFKNKKRGHKHHTAKYIYPDNCKTQYERQLFRNNTRNNMKSPKVTESIVWEIIEDKPVLFVKRVSHYRDNHWVYSEPVEGMKTFVAIYPWPKDLVHITNIVRTLKSYYDLGLYDVATVALIIYKKLGARIRRHSNGISGNPTNQKKIIKEFIARGFIEDDFMGRKGSFIQSIGLKSIYTHPNICWHSTKDKHIYQDYIYDFQVKIGIPGWTRCKMLGLENRI